MARFLLWLLMPLYMWGVTISENTTLSEDMVYNEDVIVNGAILNLNGFNMTVNGDLNISGANARLQMTMSQDKLVVTGDLIFAGASTYQDLTNGVIELAGNFYQKGVTKIYDCGWNCTGSGLDNVRYGANNAYSFYPTDNHKVILNGSSKQIVSFEAPNYSRFNHLEIQNSSSDGVVFEQLNIVGEWKRNNHNVMITDIRNFTLTENYTIPNDVEVIGGIVNLNGFTLTVNGNLKFKDDNCRLQMKKADDKLIVTGNLTFNGASTYQDLTNGVIELAGNFYQKGVTKTYSCGWNCTGSGLDNVRYGANNAYSLYPTENHKVILNGDSLQRVNFEAPEHSRFANLEISNDNVIFDLEADKKVSVIDGLYLDESLYNSTYKNNEFITYGRYRDIHKTYMTLYRGLNLIALPIKQTLTKSQINTIFSDQNISHVLKYDSDSKKWQGFGNNEVARKKIADNNVGELSSIKAGEGFYVKAESEVELKFPRDEGYGMEHINIDELSSGWHLVGSNKVIQVDELLKKNSNIKVIRKKQDGKDVYWSLDEDIQDEYRRRGIEMMEDNNVSNDAFWVYVD